MKHIKIFEEYKDEMYTYMSNDIKSPITQIPFTQSEFDDIKSALKNIPFFINPLNDWDKFQILVFPADKVRTWMFITKHPDEWYIIYNSLEPNEEERRIKCDQFDGLLQYINDNKYKLNSKEYLGI
jgi:hypothetical protein